MLKKLNKAERAEGATVKPSPTIGLILTRPQLERIAYQLNAGLGFSSEDARKEAVEINAIYQNDEEGIDFRWHPEFIRACTDKNLANFVLSCVSSNETISEKDILSEL